MNLMASWRQAGLPTALPRRRPGCHCGNDAGARTGHHLQVGFHHTASEAAALVAKVGSPGLSYMLDTIHMHIEEASVRHTIEQHARQIRHFHLCESNGGPFGSGAIDFPDVLDALRKGGYEKFISVKIYRELGWEQAARTAAERILPLLSG